MQIDKLLAHVTGLASESSRQQQLALAAMLADDGYPVSEFTVKKWVQRQSIPSHWLGRVAVAAANRGRGLNLPDFL